MFRVNAKSEAVSVRAGESTDSPGGRGVDDEGV